MTFELIALGLLLMMVCSALVLAFLRAFYNKSFKKALLYKGLASACFVIFGALNFIIGEFSLTKLIILLGLCFGIVGDEIIALCQVYPKKDLICFFGGGIFFAIGHALYIFAMIFMNGPNWIAVVISLISIALISLFYESKRRFLVGEIKNSLKLYIAVVILFASVGVATFLKNGNAAGALLAVGGVLFVLSDNVLFAFKFGKNPRFIQNIILHIAYYLAQFAIAWSIALI